MEWYFVVLIVLGAIAVLYVVACIFLSDFVFKLATTPQKHKKDDARKCEKDWYNSVFDDYDNEWKHTPFTLKTNDGLSLQCERIFSRGQTGKKEKVAVFCHGHTMCYQEAIKYARPFYNLGYEIFMFDARYFGESEGVCTTLGMHESDDLICVLNYVKSECKDSFVVVHGVSMGAATSLLASANDGADKLADAIIADCPFADTMTLYREILRKRFHFPSFPTVDFACLRSKRKYAYDFKKVRPIDAVKQTQIPICFIHGSSDTFIRVHHSQDMFAVCKNKDSELHVFEGAEHAQSIGADKEKYEDVETSFVDKIYKKYVKE